MSKVVVSIVTIVAALFLLRATFITSRRSQRYQRKPETPWQLLNDNVDPTEK